MIVYNKSLNSIKQMLYIICNILSKTRLYNTDILFCYNSNYIIQQIIMLYSTTNHPDVLPPFTWGRLVIGENGAQ